MSNCHLVPEGHRSSSSGAGRCSRQTYANKYIRFLKSIRPGDRVIVLVIVSTRQQRPHLNVQETQICECVEQRGATIVKVYRYIGKRYEPTWIKKYVRRSLRPRAKWIVAVSIDRFSRHVNFRQNRKLQATEKQLRELHQVVQIVGKGRVRLATISDPSATNAECQRIYTSPA
jgi:hypothetical protein